MCIRDRYVADRKILFYLIEGERFTVSSFEKQDLPKEEAGLDRTLSLIDTFLSSLPEEPVVMELPMDVTTDYTSFLLHEEEHEMCIRDRFSSFCFSNLFVLFMGIRKMCIRDRLSGGND